MSAFLKAIAIGLIAAAIWAIGTCVYNRVKSPLVVHPSRLPLTASNWDKTSIFEVKNRDSERTFYSIWLKLRGNDTELNFKDIEITTENNEAFVSGKVMDITVNYELVKIHGLDPEKRPAIYLILYSLQSNQSKLFKIRNRRSQKSSTKPFELLLNIMGFSESPAPMASQDDKTALQIQPPEPIELKSFSFMLKRDDDS